jgi:hypothetical protein
MVKRRNRDEKTDKPGTKSKKMEQNHQAPAEAKRRKAEEPQGIPLWDKLMEEGPKYQEMVKEKEEAEKKANETLKKQDDKHRAEMHEMNTVKPLLFICVYDLYMCRCTIK